MDPNNSVEVRNVCKTFKIKVQEEERRSIISKRIEKTILDDISFTVKKGEVLGILGRNGAGKSTLLKLISRIMEPDKGTIEYSGKMATILELGMGFHPDMSGRENIYLKGEMYGFTKEQLKLKIDKIIDYSGIREYIDNPVRTYSSGMTGRLAFAIMTNVDAEIVLVDEVLSTGDAAFSAKAREHFLKMAESGHTVLFVSHNISVVEEMCTRAIWIEAGKIKMDGNVKTVCSKYRNAIAEDPMIVMDLAKSHVPDSQYKLAMMYRDGVGMPQDYNEYFRWLKKAARGRHVRAQVEYANILIKDPTKRDDAIRYYKDAAIRGDQDACTKVAALASGEEVDELRFELSKLYEEIVKRGDPLFEFRYADFLLKTSWSNDDKVKAFEWFKKAADDGNIKAMHQTAIMCRDGIGTKKDTSMMEQYLIMASNKSHIPSILMLADYYSKGVYLVRDEHKGFIYYEKAAMLGDNNSRFKVAEMCSRGNGTEKDIEKSNRYYNEFAQNILNNHCTWVGNELLSSDFETSIPLYGRNVKYNNMSSIIDVIHSYIAGNATKEEFDEAFEKLKFLALNYNTAALTKLADMYYYGYGVEQNYQEAAKWYSVGVELSISNCMMLLGNMYVEGKLGESGVDKGPQLLFRAAELGRIPPLVTILGATYGKDAESYDRALSMLTNYAMIGRTEAIKALGDLYYDGKNAEKDLDEALKWYELGSRFANSHCIGRVKAIEGAHNKEDKKD